MLYVLVLSLVTITSSRSVHDDKDWMAVLDIFGLRNGNNDTEESFNIEVTRQSKMVHSHPNYRQDTIQTTEPYRDHHNNWHHHREDRGDFHEQNISQKINNQNHHIDTARSESRNTETSTQRMKTNERNKTEISKNPAASVNNSQSFNKTVQNDTKSDTNEARRNTTKKITLSARVLIDESTTNETRRNNSANMEGDRWIWDSGTTTVKPTTKNPTTFGLGDRAAFSGDGCPTNKVKFGNTCVDED